MWWPALVFPRDREEEFHGRLVALAQEQIRKVLDCLRNLSLMMETLFQGKGGSKAVEQGQLQVLASENEAKEGRRVIESEIAKVGAILANREDFMRLVDDVDKIADLAEGISFRIVWLSKDNMRVKKNVLKELHTMTESVLVAVTRLREALLAVTLSAETFSNKIKETEDAEHRVDEMYRRIDLMILESDMKIAPLLLTREVAGMLEDVADKAEEAADTLRALSLAIL